MMNRTNIMIRKAIRLVLKSIGIFVAAAALLIFAYVLFNTHWGKKYRQVTEAELRRYQDYLDAHGEIGFYPQPLLYILPGYPNRPAGGYPVCPNCIIIHRNLDILKEKASEFARWITAHKIGHQY